VTVTAAATGHTVAVTHSLTSYEVCSLQTMRHGGDASVVAVAVRPTWTKRAAWRACGYCTWQEGLELLFP
jgi:hypothetical protein